MATDGEGKATVKVGEGHLAAMGRQGLHELRGAIYTGSNVAQSTEYGVFGTQTPGEVAEARRGDVHGVQRDQEGGQPSVLSERLKEADARAERAERETPTKERGMDRG